MDVKELLKDLLEEGPGYREGRSLEVWKATVAALELAAAVDGPEEACPWADSIIACIGEIDSETCDEIRQLERRMLAALRTLKAERERATLLTKLCQLLGDNPNYCAPPCDYKCETCDCGYRAWKDELDGVRDALAAQEGRT